MLHIVIQAIDINKITSTCIKKTYLSQCYFEAITDVFYILECIGLLIYVNLR